VQGFDRYAYVNNSPTNFTDPTGHQCTPEDGCDRPSGDTPLPVVIISEGDKPDDLTPDGEDAYNGIIYLANMQDTWWNEDGIFTLQELLAILLFQETSAAVYAICDSQGNCEYHLPKIVNTAAAVKFQQYCISGWNTASCLNSFWGYYQPIMTVQNSPDLQIKFCTNDLSNLGGYGDVYMREAGNVLSSPPIPVTQNTPIGWADVPAGSSVAQALNVGVAYSHPSNNNIFFVVTAPQQAAICKKLGYKPNCNLSNIKK
jgi:hypothetical protein